MIQRVQSLYLLGAVIVSIAYSFMPIALFTVNGNSYLVKPLGIFFQEGGEWTYETPVLALGIVLIFHVLLTLAAIFQFKNRGRQLRLVNLDMILLLIIMGLQFIVSYDLPEKITESSELTTQYEYWVMIPLISLLLVFLARKGIQKDEDLIKSMDRIR
ncbi:DUF4293 domain-containing protein [bacterium SCSIO 12741]|nr:DUF4293 domain-containing protein [bacterium SCSIO 12741]